VYQAARSGPRSEAPNAGLAMKLKSTCEPPRTISSPVSTPAQPYASDCTDFASAAATALPPELQISGL
jgi:hypothetical protein